MARLYTQNELMLIACASTDPTRLSMQGVYHDRDLPYCVTTDGHRLHATKNYHRFELAGSICETDILRRTGRMIPLDIKSDYPDWKQVIPSWVPTAAVLLTVPSYVPARKNVTMPVTIVIPDSLFNEGAPILVMGPACGHLADVPSVTLNLALLQPYAGSTVKVWFKDATSPICVTDVSADISTMRELFTLDWFSIVMPMRLKGSPALVERSGIALQNALDSTTDEPKESNVVAFQTFA